MGKIALTLLLLLAGCRDGRLQAVTKCGQSCGSSIGDCRPGTWECPTEGTDEDAVCLGATYPSDETCDNHDNDCDGMVDEGVIRFCENGCGSGQQSCYNGFWWNCTAPAPQPEICNGRDDNCDGRIDEADGLPIEYCYTGPVGSVQHGACRPGVQRCQFGSKTCVGEILPSPEDCNGLDDDCDGMVDDGATPGGSADIVFIIDNSGSMGGTISAVKQAASSFSSTYAARTDLRWALVTAPDPDAAFGAQVRLRQDLSGAGAFAAAMMPMNATGSGEEPTLDALIFLAQPTNPLQLTWRPGSRHVLVLFTDELPQSWVSPSYTEMQVKAALTTSQARVYVFTDSGSRPYWSPVLPPNYGQLKDLTSVASVMEQELTTIIQSATCQ